MKQKSLSAGYVIVRKEILTWNDVEQLIDHLIPQFETEYDAMMMITRGGIIPGGMLAQALDVTSILTAAVDFPASHHVLPLTRGLIHRFRPKPQREVGYPNGP